MVFHGQADLPQTCSYLLPSYFRKVGGTHGPLPLFHVLLVLSLRPLFLPGDYFLRTGTWTTAYIFMKIFFLYSGSMQRYITTIKTIA
jgi:hypothetical protein